MGLGVVDKTLGNGRVGHILQAEGLGTDLERIVVEVAPKAAFVLHGVELAIDFFNQVRFTDQTVAIALEPHRPHLPGVVALVATQGMDAIVQAGAFEGVLVVDELPSAEHAPAAVGAVGVLIEGGDRDIVSLGHRFQSSL